VRLCEHCRPLLRLQPQEMSLSSVYDNFMTLSLQHIWRKVRACKLGSGRILAAVHRRLDVFLSTPTQRAGASSRHKQKHVASTVPRRWVLACNTDAPFPSPRGVVKSDVGGRLAASVVYTSLASDVTRADTHTKLGKTIQQRHITCQSDSAYIAQRAHAF